MAAMVHGGGFAALAALDEEERGKQKKGGKQGGATAPLAQATSALTVGEPQLNRDNQQSPWFVLISGQSGVPTEFSLSFLKDFKKIKCPRGKAPTLKDSEKELVVKKFKKARKEAKKERAKQQQQEQQQQQQQQPQKQQQQQPQKQPSKPSAARPASAPTAVTEPIQAGALEAQMVAGSTLAPAPSAPADDDEDYQQMLMMIRESTGLNLTFVAGGSSVVAVPEPPTNAWTQGAPTVADLNWQQQQQMQEQHMPEQWQQHEWQATQEAPVVGPDDYVEELDDDGPVEDEWQAVGKAQADASGSAKKKNSKKKKKKKKNTGGKKSSTQPSETAGGFAALGALAAGDDSDEEPEKNASAGTGTGRGLSVSQLSVPRKVPGNRDCPWVVDLTLQSGQLVTIGLDFLKAARLDDLNAGKLDLKYAEKDRALHKYKDQRKLEKKQRAKEAKEQSKSRQEAEQLTAAASPSPIPASTIAQANELSSDAAVVQKPVLTRLSGLGEPDDAGVEVLPGISFTPPAPAADASAADNRMTWRRQLPDGRVQTITTTTTQAEAQNWRSTIARLQQKPALVPTRTQTGLTPRKSSSWAIRVRWADGSSCNETDQYNAPAAFVAFGPIKSAVFRPGKPHGWIDYVDESAAFVGRVCAQMDGQVVCGRRVRVEPVENEAGKQQWKPGKDQPRQYKPNAPPRLTQTATQQQIIAAQVHQEKMRGYTTNADAGTSDEQGDNDAPAGDGGEAFWREYTLDLHAKGSYVPRHLRKYLPQE